MPIEISARHRGHMGATATRWSACCTVGLTIVGLFLAAGSHCWAVAELPDDWVSRNQPTSDQQLIQLFLSPRVGAARLHSFEDVDRLIAESLKDRSIDRVFELFERRVSESGDMENAYGIVQLRAANSWATDFQQQLQGLPIPPSQEMLDDFYGQFLERLVACHASFDRASQRGSKIAVLNLHLLAEIVKQYIEVNPTWNGTVDQNNSAREIPNLTEQQTRVRKNALTLLGFLQQEDALCRSLEQLGEQGYWPALEAKIRIQYSLSQPLLEIEKTALQLLEAKEADKIARLVAAGTVLQASVAEDRKPPQTVLLAAQEASAEGIQKGHLLASEYHLLNADMKAYRAALEQGSLAMEPTCLYQLGRMCFVEDKLDDSFRLLKSAYDLGVIEAACFLGWLREQGVGTGSQARTALEYYNAGVFAGDPECAERIGQLYVLGKVKAPISDLDYQIPGVPTLPEPTLLEKQIMSNLTYAKVYFEKASELYLARGNQNSASLIDQLLKLLDKDLEKVSTAHIRRASEDWNTQERDFQLDRRFQQLIDQRNQDRIDTERRNEKIDRHFR